MPCALEAFRLKTPITGYPVLPYPVPFADVPRRAIPFQAARGIGLVEEVKGFVGVAFFAAFFVGAPMFCAWLVVKGVRTGVVRARGGGPYARADSPAFFWITITVYAVLTLWLGRYGVLIGLDMWRNP